MIIRTGSSSPANTLTCRLWWWDRLRLLAYLDVAALHVTGRYALFGIGLPLFLTLRFLLIARRSSARSYTEAMSAAADLLVPWLAWSGFFVMVRVARSVVAGRPFTGDFNWMMIAYGSEQHLWFLPFAAVAGIVVHVMARRLSACSDAAVAGGSLIAAVLALTHSAGTLPYPFGQWRFALAAIPLALLLDRICRYAQLAPGRRGSQVAFAIASATVVIAILLAQESVPLHLGSNGLPPALRYVAAACLLAGAAMLPNMEDALTRRITPLLLGGYLLTWSVYYDVVARLERSSGLGLGSGRLALAVMMTLLLVSGLRRTPARSIL